MSSIPATVLNRHSYSGILIGTYTCNAIFNGIYLNNLDHHINNKIFNDMLHCATAEHLVKLTINCHFTGASIS